MLPSKLPRWASYSTAARWLSLTVSTFTTMLTIWVPSSVAARSAQGEAFLVWWSSAILALCALGWADVIWHDIGGRLIWPKLNAKRRHKVCVFLYVMLSFAFLQRAFVSAEDFVLLVPFYYLAAAVGIGLTALAVAIEERASCTNPPP